MNVPLFSYDEGDLQVYESLEDLVRAVEKFDVEQKAYVFWDVNGIEFDLDTNNWPSFFGTVNDSMVTTPESSIGIERIGEIVREYCATNGVLIDGSLSATGQALLKHLKYR